MTAKLKLLSLILVVVFISNSSAIAYAENEEKLVTDSIFSPNSFWYQSIPADAPLNVNSSLYVAEFQRQVKAYYGTVTINTSSYSSPVYYATPDAQTVKVEQWDCQGKGYKDKNLSEQWAKVPIPSNAVPAKGTDAEMSVYQASTDTLWEFWQARKVNGVWQACWGGRMQKASKSDGVFPGYYGTTATSLPFIGGQITAEELKRGEIKHVMGIALVDLENYTIFSWPAHRSDGYNPSNAANRIPEGLRFRLDPELDVDKLNMSRAGKTIAKAAQKYGFIVWDKAGAISLRAQNSLSYTTRGEKDPYGELFSGAAAYDVLKGFPWDRLQFMPLNYGKKN